MEILSLDPTYRFPFPHQITASTPTLSRRAPSMSRCPLKSSELPPNFPQILQITPNFPQNYQNYHITPKMLYEQGLFCDKRLYLCCGFQAGSPQVSHHFSSVMLRLSPVHCSVSDAFCTCCSHSWPKLSYLQLSQSLPCW